MEKIKEEIRQCKTFLEFLQYVKKTEGLRLVTDNGWSWLEFNGQEIEGSGKERFTNDSEIKALLTMAGVN